MARKSPAPPLYLDWGSWIPIHRAYEERKPSYFATPATSLVMALETGLGEVLENGIETLNHLDPYIFNILCLPGAATMLAGSSPDTTNIAAVYSYAANFCDTNRAMLIVDIPAAINSTPGS